MKILAQYLFSFYLWTLVTLVTVTVSSLVLLTFPLVLFDPHRRLAHRLGHLWAMLLIKLNPFWHVRVVGQKNVQKNKSYVLVANHASLVDIICLFSLRYQFKWLAKKSLFQIPFLGWAMSVMGYIPLERGRHGSIRTSYQQALKWLQKDISVLVFPEGTRSRTGEMGHFKSGAFRLALESGHPILPIVLAGTQKVLSKGKAAFGKPGLAYMSILEPVGLPTTEGADEEAIKNKVEALMRKEWVKRNRMLARTPVKN